MPLPDEEQLTMKSQLTSPIADPDHCSIACAVCAAVRRRPGRPAQAESRRRPPIAAPCREAKPAWPSLCAAGNSTMQTDAAVDPSRHSASTLASLATRGQSRTGAAAGRCGDAAARWPANCGPAASRPPRPATTPQTSLALKRLIRQVRGLTLNNKSPAPPAAAPAESPTTAEPPAPVDREHREHRSRPRRKPVAAAASDDDTGPVAQDAEDARRSAQESRPGPRSAGDGGAAVPERPAHRCRALLRGSPAAHRAGDAASGADRAWILFQLGNCLRETDIAKAQDAYMKLIAEYPDSPWTEMAQASGRLLTWYQSTRPDQLMARPSRRRAGPHRMTAAGDLDREQNRRHRQKAR